MASALSLVPAVVPPQTRRLGIVGVGARDPFPAEIESNFGSKVIGNASTEHVILVPSMPVAIADKSCVPISPGTAPMAPREAKDLLRKLVGWRLDEDGDVMKLQCEFKIKSFAAGVELVSRIAAVAETQHYYPTLQLDSKRAKVEIWTWAIGGLSENDFILAAKIDKHVNTADLIKKERVWA